MNDRLQHIRNTYTKYGDNVGKETAVGHIRELITYIDSLEMARAVILKRFVDERHNDTAPLIPGGQGNHYHRCYENYCEEWEEWDNT